MKLQISHETTYRYDEPVQYGLQQIRLTPKKRSNQHVVDWHVDISGGKVELEFEDQNCNHTMLVSVTPDESEVIITAHGTVETDNTAGVIGKHSGYAPLWHFKQQTVLTQPGLLVTGLVNKLGRDFNDDISCLHALSALVREEVEYELGHTDISSNVEDVMKAGKGVCQDHTHVFVSAARLMNFPARYVSGYLMLDDRIDQDATHAWVEAHIDGLGWVGFDISNGISQDERYVPVATGLDYPETSPVSGMRYGDSDESMIVNLQVEQ